MSLVSLLLLVVVLGLVYWIVDMVLPEPFKKISLVILILILILSLLGVVTLPAIQLR